MMAKFLHSSLGAVCKAGNPCLKFHFFFSERSYTTFSRCPTQIQHVGLGHNVLFPMKMSQSFKRFPSNCDRIPTSTSSLNAKQYNTKAPNGLYCRLPHRQLRHTLVPFPMYLVPNFRLFSSYFGGKEDKTEDAAETPFSGVGEVGEGDGGVVTINWMGKIKDAWNSMVDAASYTTQKVQETADELTPHVQQLLDSQPYLKNVIIPITGTLSGTLLAWAVMPRILRKFHKYAIQGPSILRSEILFGDEVPYERSVWGALEDPVRYLVTFIAFTQIAIMIAPSTIASQYIVQAWRGAVILSFVWFLFRWKTNVFSRVVATKSLSTLERERLIALDRISSVGLFAIGLIALAEACGVAVQSLLTVGGIGGVATAFAARDVLGNVLSGLSMQFTKPFSLGDTIKAGSIEGQVMEMGLTTTSLLNAEKFPVIVPNSLFSSQVIVNKSRAEWCALVRKIPLHGDDMDKIPQISNDIKNMLKSHPKVFLGKEVPYCFLSQVESSCAELTIGCNLNHMSRDELYSTQQDILLQSIQIIKGHGARLGSTIQDINYR